MKETKKTFKCPRRDGSDATFTFVKLDGFWHWDLPEHISKLSEDMIASLPLPDVNLDSAKTLKDCLDLIGQKRGQDWVGQVVVDLLKPIETE